MATSNEGKCVIRLAREDDCEDIAALIKELACSLKMTASAKLDAETLRRDGFQSEKMFHCFVAEDTTTKKLVGHALYYFNYSAWEGVNVYLDDLYVSPEYRGRGLGTQLWREVAKTAVDKGYNRLDWQVLDWNKASIEYYEAKGARNLTHTEGTCKINTAESMATVKKENCVIRKAREEDCEGIVVLIKELACFEKMPDSVRMNADTLRKDGFGAEKMFNCFVAEDVESKKLVGYALYFYNYSTWEGVNVYLEDLYVSPDYRHGGLGTEMWREVAKVAVERGCNRLDWVCLDWNKASIGYYKSKGARNLTETEGWDLFRLDGEKLKAFVAE